MTSEAKRQVKSKDPLETYTQSAADELEKIAEGARAAACELEEQDEQRLSNYVLDAADRLFKFADQLRGKSAEQLFHEANRLAKDNPALFLTGSIAVGFGLTRFARASGHRSPQPSRQAESGLSRPMPGSALDQESAGLGLTGSQAGSDVTRTTVTATPDGTVSTSKPIGRSTQPLPPGDISMTGSTQTGIQSTGPTSQSDKGSN
ncbi:hypothetical protein [Azotobacter armeniacus]